MRRPPPAWYHPRPAGGPKAYGHLRRDPISTPCDFPP
jgi:hypothetical protein